MRDMAPIHPGEILREEFLSPLDLSVYALAKALDVPQTRMAEIVHERRSITADTAIRLGRFLGTSPEFWLNLQARFDLETTLDEKGDEIVAKVKPLDRAAA
jgi:addiction module HigA family antidote